MIMKSHQNLKKKKKNSNSSTSKRFQNEVSVLLLHYYKEGLTVDEVIFKNISGIPCSTRYFVITKN